MRFGDQITHIGYTRFENIYTIFATYNATLCRISVYYVVYKYFHDTTPQWRAIGMKLLALLEATKYPLNEGIMDAMIETAVPEATSMLYCLSCIHIY